MIPSNSPLVAALVTANTVPSATVTFAISGAGLSVDTGEPVGVVESVAWSAAEMDFIRASFQYISTVVNLNFIEVANAGSATISFAKVQSFGSDTTGYSDGFSDGSSQIVIAAPYINVNDTTVIHEIGHSLGLAHPHDDVLFPGVTGAFNAGDLGLNNEISARMSYVPAALPGTADLQITGIGVSFGAVDIAALQSLYEPNNATGLGDTTYGDVVGQQTIWDNGGSDTIDFSGAAENAVIDLRATTLFAETGGGGFLSYIGREGGTLATGGYTIAFGVEVENAIGGSGADLLTGNALANWLTGGAGDDMLEGGAGTDTAVYSGNQSSYTLTLSAQNMILADRSGMDGIDTLSSIEALTFGDAAVAPFDLTVFAGTAGLGEAEMKSFIELYIAYFNRAPDAVGLNFWGTAFANGTSLERMTELFNPQPETQATYPAGTSNADFVTAIYSNLFGRAPDADGFGFWVGQLDGGAARDGFILSVLRGARADLDPSLGQAVIDQQLADRVYLDTKTDIGTYFAVTRGMSNVDNGRAAMDAFDGTTGSIAAAVSAIDGYFAAAQDALSGEFLMPLVGVVDDPFAAVA